MEGGSLCWYRRWGGEEVRWCGKIHFHPVVGHPKFELKLEVVVQIRIQDVIFRDSDSWPSIVELSDHAVQGFLNCHVLVHGAFGPKVCIL